ncbi:hypothetical protein SB783_37610 [Paraburkholderia sp. SIMBA_009]
MRVLMTVLFHILYTLRGLFRIVCRLLSGLFLFGFLGTLVFGGGRVGWSPKLTMLAFGVGFGALAWYYDVLLLKLAPENVNLVLFD